jgi:hypothetical protein
MFFLTDQAKIVCKHELGQIQNVASQNWVKIAAHPILVDSDPEGRTIKGCPMYGVGIKPCQNTLKVTMGYSKFIRVGGKAVSLDSLSGLTDGTPPGAVKYKANYAGQEFVSEIKK